MPIIDSFDVHL